MIFIFITLAVCGQSISFEFTPSFSAIIVKNIDSSSKWYQSVFDLKVKEQMKDEKAGYNIIILESRSYTLELLELKNSFNPKDGKAQNTEAQGIFKFGFHVKNMDDCLRHLQALKISVPQVWTDSKTKKRNFLITDLDGNLIQFFE